MAEAAFGRLLSAASSDVGVVRLVHEQMPTIGGRTSTAVAATAAVVDSVVVVAMLLLLLLLAQLPLLLPRPLPPTPPPPTTTTTATTFVSVQTGAPRCNIIQLTLRKTTDTSTILRVLVYYNRSSSYSSSGELSTLPLQSALIVDDNSLFRIIKDRPGCIVCELVDPRDTRLQCRG